MICPMKFNECALDARMPDLALSAACELDCCAWWDAYAGACAVKSLVLLRRIEDVTLSLNVLENRLNQLNLI